MKTSRCNCFQQNLCGRLSPLNFDIAPHHRGRFCCFRLYSIFYWITQSEMFGKNYWIFFRLYFSSSKINLWFASNPCKRIEINEEKRNFRNQLLIYHVVGITVFFYWAYVNREIYSFFFCHRQVIEFFFCKIKQRLFGQLLLAFLAIIVIRAPGLKNKLFQIFIRKKVQLWYDLRPFWFKEN